MNQTLWRMPELATTIIRGPIFEILQKRQCKISFSIEGENGEEKWLSLLFEGVEAFKCTYLTSIGSTDIQLRRQSYETVISISESRWLQEVKRSYIDYCTSARLTPKALQHLMITFDDGPCYEFICEALKVV